MSVHKYVLESILGYNFEHNKQLAFAWLFIIALYNVLTSPKKDKTATYGNYQMQSEKTLTTWIISSGTDRYLENIQYLCSVLTMILHLGVQGPIKTKILGQLKNYELGVMEFKCIGT